MPDLPTFTIFGQPIGLLEILATITGLINTYLLIKNSVWNWFWGILSALLFGAVFYEYKLFSNMGLQIVYYVPMMAYGWYLWTRGTPGKQDDLPITMLRPFERVNWIVAASVASGIWGAIMSRTTPAALPYADALNTGMSVIALYLQSKRKFESWWFWLAVNLLGTFYLYPMQKLYLTTVLYALFTIMAFLGAREWTKLMRQQREDGEFSLFTNTPV